MNSKIKAIYIGVLNVQKERMDTNLKHYCLFRFGDDWGLWYFGEDKTDEDADGNLYTYIPLQKQIDKWR